MDAVLPFARVIRPPELFLATPGLGGAIPEGRPGVAAVASAGGTPVPLSPARIEEAIVLAITEVRVPRTTGEP